MSIKRHRAVDVLAMDRPLAATSLIMQMAEIITAPLLMPHMGISLLTMR